MKRIRPFSILLCMLALTAACRQEKNAGDIPGAYPAMLLSQKDTATVLGLVNRFMTFAQNKEYAEAAAMLCKMNASGAGHAPEALDSEDMRRVRTLFGLFPVRGYKIDKIQFKEAEDNEVRCTVYFTGDKKTNWYFKPVRYLGNWKLCMKDSGTGDKAID